MYMRSAACVEHPQNLLRNDMNSLCNSRTTQASQGIAQRRDTLTGHYGTAMSDGDVPYLLCSTKGYRNRTHTKLYKW